MELQRFIVFGIAFAAIRSISDCIPRKPKQQIAYGEYEMKIQRLEKCPNALGPFDSELYNQYEIFWKEENGKTIIYGYVNIKRSHQVQNVTFLADLWNGTKLKQVCNLTIQKPCERRMVQELLDKLIASKIKSNCQFPKGNFTISISNIDYLIKKFIGKKFYLGKVTLDILYYSSRGLTSCMNVTAELIPLTKIISNKSNS